MSIAWMTRVWSSSEPSHPTDRLMLLALADNANDEGVCWPSVETLQCRCSLQTLRGARKVLERLKRGGFIRRVERPGRSNVYELTQKRLATPERQDRGGAAETPERGDRGPRSARTSRTNIEPSKEPSLNNNSRRQQVSEDVDVSDRRWVEMLVTHGVHEPVAERLVEQFGRDVVERQVEHYDELCSRGEAPRGAGWLVKAIEDGYPVPETNAGLSKLFTYHEMLAWCEARGDLSLTRGFTPVKQDGKTFFQLSRSARHASLHEPPSTDHHAPRSHQE